MGAQATIVEDIQESVIKITTGVIVANSSTCSASAGSSQSAEFGTIKGDLIIKGLKFGSKQKIDLKCLQSSEFNQEMQADIEKKLTADIKNKLEGQNIGAVQTAITKTTKKAITDLTSTLDISNIKNCIAQSISSQKISAETVGGNVLLYDVNMDNVQEVVGDCIQNDNTVTKSINKLQEAFDTEVSNTLVGFLNANVMIIFIIIAAIVALILGMKFLKGKGGNAYSGRLPPYQEY